MRGNENGLASPLNACICGGALHLLEDYARSGVKAEDERRRANFAEAVSAKNWEDAESALKGYRTPYQEVRFLFGENSSLLKNLGENLDSMEVEIKHGRK